MAKTTNLYVRVEPELKEQAETILEQLGIQLSNAVNIFLKQVVMQNGIPFPVKLPSVKPITMSNSTEEQLNTELNKGYDDYLNGRTKSAIDAVAEIRKDYGIRNIACF
jgi:DNA-damage-inducible protein J